MTTVRDAMTTEVRTVARLTPVTDVVALLGDAHVRHVPVVDPGDVLVGIITDRDVRGRALGPMTWLTDAEMQQALSEMTAREIMTDDVLTVTPDTDLRAAAQIFVDRHVGCLPVVVDGRLVGILTETDVVRRYAEGA